MRGTGIFIAIGAVLLLVVAIPLLVVDKVQKSRPDLPALGEVPPFELTERSGEPFGRKDLDGRINVVDFIFTNCKGACPVMSTFMSDLYETFDTVEAIRFVSISVDPDRDSLAVLGRYADDFGVDDDRWVFLRGPIDSVVTLCEEGFMMAAEGLPMGHSTRFVLVDRTGQIRGYYDGMDAASMDTLEQHLAWMAGNE